MITVPPVEICVTQEDIDHCEKTGMVGTEVVEHAIDRFLDQQSVPRKGRVVIVTREEIEITLPDGFQFVAGAD